ncbi:MAG: pyridine nucleotide-disulfide oxidoreductase [Ruminococcaceae bacterium]|nr:pyridine nucleotide-disulfide oxidoreductase [Oscillospiraceae bacterium]
MKKKLVIIGSGPSGLVSAMTAVKSGISASDILVLERENELGGTLNQCIHTGFMKNLTGTELASNLIKAVKKLGIECRTESCVLSLTPEKILTVISPKQGYQKIQAEAVILAMGCREQSRGVLSIGGTRPAGVLSAGAAQKYINIDGYMPGKKTVVIGSTDIAFIIARRLAIEGGRVITVVEPKGAPLSDKKNIKEYLHPFNIPFELNHNVTKIYGKERIEAVDICQLDKKGKPIKKTKRKLECDSLVYSCGYTPDVDIAVGAGARIKRDTKGPYTKRNYETTISGVFVTGNAHYIHKNIDKILKESVAVAEAVAKFLQKPNQQKKEKKNEDNAHINSENQE